MEITKQQAQINRSLAIARGEKTYQGRPCKNGHEGVKLTVGRSCIECKLNRERSDREKQRRKEYNSIPENQVIRSERNKRYRARPEIAAYIKERNREFRARPETKERSREYFHREDKLFKTLARTARARARLNGIDSEITEQDLTKLWDEQKGLCYYDGTPMDKISGHGVTNKNPNKVSIDRLDSSKGYVLGNVVLCKFKYNKAKMDTPEKEFAELCQAMAHYSAIKRNLELFESALA